MNISMSSADWVNLFNHFTALSLMGVGGAITTAPDMQRYLVVDQQWLTDRQFISSIALAQAAPSPNVLFVALMGWNVGRPARLGAGATGRGGDHDGHHAALFRADLHRHALGAPQP